MSFSSDTYVIIFLFALIAFIIIGFVRIAVKSRKGLGAYTTLMYGATDEFYTTDKKRAIEIVVEKKAGKKMEEQENGQPNTD